MSRYKKIKTSVSGLSKQRLVTFVFIGIFAVVGAAILIATRAATLSKAIEAESGILTSPVTVVNNTNASGGKVIKFGTIPPVGGAYDPDPWCQFHVMGSLYGDGSGNGPPNGATWNPNNKNWGFSNGSDAVVDRFERCARYVKANNIGGNSGATITRSGGSVSLSNYWPVGVNLPFYDDRVNSNLGSGANPLAKRAFVMSIIEGEGEKCDPAGGNCPTAQVEDNYQTVDGQTNLNYYKHLTTMIPTVKEAGLATAFTASGDGCMPKTEAQLASGGGGAVCIKSSDYTVIKNWPIAACARVPGYGTISGYQCGKADAP